MKTGATLAIATLLGVAACSPRNETGRADGADTVVTQRQEMDTSIITHDTTVEVDTVRREGDAPVREDTVQR